MMNRVNLRFDRERARHILSKYIPWSPLDFIKEISQEGDKSIFIDKITAEIDPANDLRFIYEVGDKEELAILAEKLPWDSEFFSYGVGKINGIFPLSEPYYRPYADYTAAIETLIKLSREKGIKYLFGNVDSRDLALMRSMGNLGFSLIETRLSYHRDIRNYEYKERFAVRVAKEEDIESLGSAVVIKANIYDRFHSDPFISKRDAERLMHKWVEASINEGFADITMVPDVIKPTAFVTVKFHKENWAKWGIKIVQPVVSAVSNEYKGWYRKLISEVHYYSNGLGAEHIYMTTQAPNYAVLWVWETLGYHFGKCEHVFRIVL